MSNGDSWQSRAPKRRPPSSVQVCSPKTQNKAAKGIQKCPTGGRQLIADVAEFRSDAPIDEADDANFECFIEVPFQEVSRVAKFDRDSKALLKTLADLAYRCERPGWDEEDAEAITLDTYNVARRFLMALPRDSQLPTINPEPDGQLDFEWYQSPRRLLTVSVCATGTLYWAALIGTEDPRGSCQFVDQFPKTLLYWISQVYG